MSEDMSEMIQKMSEMLKNNEIPDNIKSIMNNLAQSSSDSSSKQKAEQENTSDEMSSQEGASREKLSQESASHDRSSQGSYSHDRSSQGSANSSDIPNIDLNTMLKMKSIIDSMNAQQNDPRSNLLRSLKPYLKPSRKEKVEQYIKLFSMGKVFEVLNPLGGEKKNDV